jgi:HAD superfamily hydrolase (TIGR01459 family)
MYIQSLHAIMDKYDNYIVDVWGVVHDGHQLFPFVRETLVALKAKRKHVIFLSNAPRRAHILAESLAEGFGLTPDLYYGVHTSGEDAYEHITHQNPDATYEFPSRKCYAILMPFHHHMIEDCKLERVGSLEEAAFILNLGPDQNANETSKDYEALLQEAKVLNLPMICVNPDLSVLLGDKIHACAGSLAQYYESIGGQVYYHGKPFESVYKSVLAKFPSPNKGRTLAIGDSLRTDVKGAQEFGLDTVLVLSGLEAHHSTHVTPEAQAEHFLKQSTLRPTYVIPGFR